MATKELTTLEIKKRFYQQFNLGAQAAGIPFSAKEVTVTSVRSCLQSKTTIVQDKRRLDATGKEFWVVALKVMDKLAAK